jgi:hypothetical protein
MSELVDVLHIRRPPYDGLLHLTGRSVYLSLTQLLIRRSLFDRIGAFDTRWGSIGDFNWDMKAGLVASTLHVPETWATFRVHSTQATASVDFNSDGFAAKMNHMIEDAVEACRPYLHPAIRNGLDERWLRMASEMREYYRELRLRASVVRRRVFQARNLFLGNSNVRSEMTRVLVGDEKWESRAYHEIENWLESLHIRPIETCDA